MKTYTDKQIIDGIRNKDNEVLTWVYKTNFNVVKRFVLYNQGNKQDAQDIFQEGLVAIYRGSLKGSLNLEFSFPNYLFSICKKLWLKELRDRKLILEGNIEIASPGADGEPDDTENDTDLFQQIVHKYLLKMDPVCRELLMNYKDRLSDKEIMENMGFASLGATYKRRSRCRQKLLDLLKEDPFFKRFLE